VRQARSHPTALLAGRAVAAGIVLVISFCAFVVFEASAKADIAERSAQAALEETDSRFRIEEFTRSARLIEDSWARPTAWHGGANETLSWIYARLAAEEGSDRDAIAKSASAAARAVAQAPIQPASWARLASLADRGAASPCTVEQCLTYSWFAAKFVDSQTGCARLRIASRHGMLKPFDARIDWFARKSLHQAEVEQCLSFLPPQELFHALMIFTIQDALWHESQRR
jgi:hypothetical protein